MSEPWWLRPEASARIVPGPLPGTVQPEVVDGIVRRHLLALRDRVPTFTPEWRRRTRDDAGWVLVALFGAQVQPLIERLNRLPEKALVDYLRLAGITPLPPSPARALVQFTAAPGAPGAVLVPRGFRVAAPPADGSDGLAVFETDRDLFVAPGEIAAVLAQDGPVLRRIDDFADRPFAPFGDRVASGRALLIGFRLPAAPGRVLSLGVCLAAASASPPVSAGGLDSHAIPSRLALLGWDALDGATYEPLEVLVDETAGLSRDGIVELRLPTRWRAGQPGVEGGDEPLYWLRVRVVQGEPAETPSPLLLRPNMVRVTAGETVRDEVLEHVPGTDDRMRLSAGGVLPGSLTLEVTEGAATGEFFALDTEPTTVVPSSTEGVRRWQEVTSLAPYGPSDRVFVLDARTGEVTFGDGIHGRALPAGFRHVRAVRYRVGGGPAGAVAADEITTLRDAVPFLQGVSNPAPATGGAEAEARDRTLRRGPGEIVTRGRAVTGRDYELLALRAPGADVVRAHAVAGLHPAYPGATVPGVVGVFVVARRQEQGPPMATLEALRSVAEHLTRNVAPAGVEVVAAVPRYQRIRVEVTIRLDPAADVGGAVGQVLSVLDRYFNPVDGGDVGAGWPLGGVVRFVGVLQRLVTAVDAVRAVSRLNLVLDGRRFPECTDVALSPHGLPWPAGHMVVPELAEERER